MDNGILLAWGLSDWFHGYMKDTASDVGAEVVNSTGSYTSQIIVDICDAMGDTFASINPSLSTWDTYIGSDVRENLMKFSQYFGVALLIFIFLMALVKIILRPKEKTDTPISLVLKFGLCGMMIYTAPSIINYVFQALNSLYVLAYNNNGDKSNFDFTNMLSIGAGDGVILGLKIACLAVFPLNAILIIIGLIISWPIIKNFFRFVLETIERYIVCVIVAFFAPVAFATLGSKDTENIFKSWARTLGASMFLLFINGMFIRCAIALIMHYGLTVNGILGYVFTLGFLRTCQRLDAIIQSAGVNIAQCTGGIADSLAGTAKSFVDTMGQRREGAGNMLKAIGAATGNQAMFAAGSKLGVGTSSIAKAGLPSAANIASDYTRARAGMGLTTPLSGQDAQDTVSRYMSGTNAYRRSVGNLDQATINNGLNGMLANTDLKNIHGGAIDSNGNASFKAIGADGVERNYQISDSSRNGSALSLEDAEGNASGFYLNTVGSMANGDVVSGSSMFEDAGAMGYEKDLSDRGVDSASYEDGLTTFKSGADNVAAMDSKGNLLESNDLMNVSITEQLNDDVKKLYPGAKFKEDANGEEIGFKINGNTVSAEIKMPGSDNYHKIYAQDAVARNTTAPSEYSNRKSMLHRNEDGSSYRTIYKMDNKRSRVEKQGDDGTKTRRK